MGLTNLFISNNVFRFIPPNLTFKFSLLVTALELLLSDYA
jgi:hypothetical protein